MSVLPADDPRWEAVLAYTTNDDGIWLIYGAGAQRILLGFDPTVWEVVAEMEALKP